MDWEDTLCPSHWLIEVRISSRIFFNTFSGLLQKSEHDKCPSGTLKLLTLSARGGAGPSRAWGGQFDPHFLTAPGGIFGHNSFNVDHYTV